MHILIWAWRMMKWNKYYRDKFLRYETWRNRFVFILYIIGLILIDQLSKVWALSALRGTEGIAVIPNVFELSYLENRGAAFGILQDHQIFFVLITVAAAVILTWIYRRIPQTKKYIPLRISYALIMAGAFGNLIRQSIQGILCCIYFYLNGLISSL